MNQMNQLNRLNRIRIPLSNALRYQHKFPSESVFYKPASTQDKINNVIKPIVETKDIIDTKSKEFSKEVLTELSKSLSVSTESNAKRQDTPETGSSKSDHKTAKKSNLRKKKFNKKKSKKDYNDDCIDLAVFAIVMTTIIMCSF